MKNFALGRYIPYNSFIHKLDPRVKILGIVLLMVCVFLNFTHPVVNDAGETVKATYWTMTAIMQGSVFVLSILLLWISHMSFRSVLASLRSLWFTLIFLLVIYILVPTQTVMQLGLAWRVEAWNWSVYWDSFADAGKIMLRLMNMLMLTMVLTGTTKPLDLTYALEWYMAPLKVLHFPAAEVAMTISIALRFIPTLLEDSMRIMKAQSSRGVDFAHGNILKRITGVTSLIIPLFVSSFLRSEELANAMECRGYDPRAKRTRYRLLKFGWRDIFGFIIPAALLGLYIWWSVDSSVFTQFVLSGVVLP